mgnify:CR=1 FL=1
MPRLGVLAVGHFGPDPNAGSIVYQAELINRPGPGIAHRVAPICGQESLVCIVKPFQQMEVAIGALDHLRLEELVGAMAAIPKNNSRPLEVRLYVADLHGELRISEREQLRHVAAHDHVAIQE